MSIANAKEHAPHTERDNHIIQDRTHNDDDNVPCTYLPKTLVEHMAMVSSKKLNFSANHGVSKHCSPRMIAHKENNDVDAHCAYAIGEYVQGEHEAERSNANAPRSLGCSYLGFLVTRKNTMIYHICKLIKQLIAENMEHVNHCKRYPAYTCVGLHGWHTQRFKN